MKKLIVLIASFTLTFLCIPLLTQGSQEKRVHLPIGMFVAKSSPVHVLDDCIIHLEVRNLVDGAGSLTYRLYQMKTCEYEDEGEEGTTSWSDCIRSGVVSNGSNVCVDKALDRGTYYVEISTSAWLPGVATPTCHGDAVFKIY